MSTIDNMVNAAGAAYQAEIEAEERHFEALREQREQELKAQVTTVLGPDFVAECEFASFNGQNQPVAVFTYHGETWRLYRENWNAPTWHIVSPTRAQSKVDEIPIRQ